MKTSGSSVWQGEIKDGKDTISTQSDFMKDRAKVPSATADTFAKLACKAKLGVRFRSY